MRRDKAQETDEQIFKRFKKQAADLHFILRLRHPYDRLLLPPDVGEDADEAQVFRAARALEYRITCYVSLMLISQSQYVEMMSLVKIAEDDARRLHAIDHGARAVSSGLYRFTLRFPMLAALAFSLAIYALLSWVMPVLLHSSVSEVALTTVWASILAVIFYASEPHYWSLRPVQTWLLAAAPLMALIVTKRIVPQTWMDRVVQPPFFQVAPFVLSVVGAYLLMRFAEPPKPAPQSTMPENPSFEGLLALPGLTPYSASERTSAPRRTKVILGIAGGAAAIAWAMSFIEFKTAVDLADETKSASIQELKGELERADSKFDALSNEHDALNKEFIRLRDGDPIDPAAR